MVRKLKLRYLNILWQNENRYIFKPTTSKFNFHKEEDEGYEYYLSDSPDIHMENKPKKPQIEKFTICVLGTGNEVEIEVY